MDCHLSLLSPRLSPEICDYILDHLWDDHKTLKVCSLVTREWFPTTRKHLFHSIRIFSDPRRVAFEDVILHSGDAVALCVRKLELKWTLVRNWTPTIPVSVPQTLASLSRLEELTLQGTVWSDSYSPAKTITWPVLPMVKAVHLQIYDADDVVSLQRFICACPSLSSLNLQIRHTPKCDSSHTHPPMIIPGSIVIGTFQYGVRESDPMLRWLLQGGLKMRIRRLAITVLDYPTSVNFLRKGDAQALLRASSECLEHLVVRVQTKIRSDSPDRQQAALTHNPNLISIYVSSVWPFETNGWLGLLSILADIQPMHTKLQSVHITLIMASKPDFRSMPCEQLDAALARIVDTHPQLIVTVCITSSSPVAVPQMTELVETLLQRLVRVQAGRGRLCLMWLNGYDENREFSHRTTPSWCSR